MKRLRTFSPAFTHLSGGEGEEGPEQPADLQQNKGHCDHGPVDDTIEEPYDRQPKEHLRLPAAFRQHFYENSIAQRCGDFKLRRPRPRSPP